MFPEFEKHRSKTLWILLFVAFSFGFCKNILFVLIMASPGDAFLVLTIVQSQSANSTTLEEIKKQRIELKNYLARVLSSSVLQYDVFFIKNERPRAARSLSSRVEWRS